MNGRFALKILAWTIALSLVSLPIVGILNGWFASERWPVRKIELEAEFNHVSAEQVRAVTMAHLGIGFFAIKLDEVRTVVAALPWVEKVEVRKRWPDTLVLRVQEQQPFARWGEKRLIGRDGSLFSAPGGESIQGLPRLDGPDDELGSVVDFYNKSQRQLTGSGMQLAGVSLSARGSWKLRLGSGAEVIVGREQADARLQRFLAVYPRLAAERSATTFERADLRYTNGFTIAWSPGSVPSTPPTQPITVPSPAVEKHA